MNLEKFIKKEKILWHNHFIPSFLAGLAAFIVSILYQLTVANIVLFASVGASAAILTNNRSHHLTKLHTTITAYLIAIIVSSAVYYLNRVISLPISLNIFLLVFLVALFLYLSNTFHPPAITASLSFMLLERPLMELIILFSEILVMLVIVRFISYVMSQHLSVKEFISEFEKSF